MLSTSTPRGFSLAEVLIALAMTAILAALALPSFADSVRRSRRAEGSSALQQLQLAEERWRADHSGYTGALSDLGTAASTTSGYYTLSISDAGAAGFTLQATAAASQAADTACAVLKLLQSGGQIVYSSIDTHNVETLTMPNRCWTS